MQNSGSVRDAHPRVWFLRTGLTDTGEIGDKEVVRNEETEVALYRFLGNLLFKAGRDFS